MTNEIRIDAELECGASVQIIQHERGMNIEFTITPKPGVDITDTADFKDGKLRVRVTEESLIGTYQLIRLFLFGNPKRKSIFARALGL